MGKDVIMSHIARMIDDNVLCYQQEGSTIDAAAAIFSLGHLAPVIDTVTGEVLGYEFKIVIKREQ